MHMRVVCVCVEERAHTFVSHKARKTKCSAARVKRSVRNGDEGRARASGFNRSVIFFKWKSISSRARVFLDLPYANSPSVDDFRTWGVFMTRILGRFCAAAKDIREKNQEAICSHGFARTASQIVIDCDDNSELRVDNLALFLNDFRTNSAKMQISLTARERRGVQRGKFKRFCRSL